MTSIEIVVAGRRGTADTGLRMPSEIQPYVDVGVSASESDSDDGDSSVFVRVWSCPGELMVPPDAAASASLGIQREVCCPMGQVWGHPALLSILLPVISGSYQEQFSCCLCCLWHSVHLMCGILSFSKWFSVHGKH